MNIHTVHLVFFSPTGSTHRVLRTLGQSLGLSVVEHDLTDPAIREQELVFSADELVVIGMPVYFGRIPAPFHAALPVRGSGTPMVAVLVYGNRAYDDALMELKCKGEEAGFIPLAGAAFIAQHSLNPVVAQNRPDASDLEKIADFGREIMDRITRIASPEAIPALEVSGSHEFRTYGAFPFVPDVYPDACTQCGLCARVCPEKAISFKDFSFDSTKTCLFCLACVKYCPSHARGLTKAQQAVFDTHMEKIAAIAAERREPETF